MSKSIDIKIEGLLGAEKALKDFVGDLDKMVYNGAKETLVKIEMDMRSRANSILNEYATGVLINSISHTIKNVENGVVGSVGVYDMSNKTGSQKRDLPSPIVANFIEGGVQPHSLVRGARAKKRGTPKNIVDAFNRKVREENPKPWHPGFSANPFMSLSFVNNADKLGINITNEIDKIASKL